MIDGDHRMYKAFYAIPGLTTPAGDPINMVYGFVGGLLKLLRTEEPEYLVVAFDTSAPTFRHESYPEYKATRKPAPDEFRAQKPVLHRVLEAMGIPTVSLAGFEADDILGTLGVRWGSPKVHVYLATGDKDAKQLIGDYVSTYDLDKSEAMGPNELYDSMGLRPEQIIEYMALVGDTVDNIPGVPKVGEKTALPLIQRYGDLENLLTNKEKLADDKELEVRGKKALGARLTEFEADARRSHELVTIHTEVPIELSLEDVAVKPFDRLKVLPLFQEFGFTNYIRDLGLIEEVDQEAAAETYTVVDSLDALDKLVKSINKLKKTEPLCLQVYARGDNPMFAELIGISLATGVEQGYYLPFRGPSGDTVLPWEEARERLRPVLEDPERGKVGHNQKYDRHVLERSGITLRGIVGDSMVAAYLLNASRSNFGLDHLAVETLYRETIPLESIIGSGKSKKEYDEVPVATFGPYAAERADVARQLSLKLRENLERDGLIELYDTIELPLLETLAVMERRGIRLDTGVLEALHTEMQGDLQQIEAEINELVGKPINLRSPKQLRVLLFEDRGYKPVKRTKTGPSTDEYTLETLAKEHPEDPLPAKLLEHRGVSYTLSSYVEALPRFVQPDTGRIHSSFHQTIAPTGRLSSMDPNLQSIPVRDEYGRRIRGAFVPQEPDEEHGEWIFAALDYSQVELRLVAHLAGDETMKAAFADNKDIHRAVAAKVNDVAEADVTSAQRSAAKAVNFGIIYGQTSFGLATNLGISRSDAQAFIDDYFDEFPAIRAYIDSTIATAHEQGYVTTISGRRRYLPELKLSNKMKRARAEREAVNTTVQGSAADLIKIAMVRLHDAIESDARPLRLLLQIHDELVFEVPASQVEEETAFARGIMEQAMELSVPLQVDVNWGQSWLETK